MHLFIEELQRTTSIILIYYYIPIKSYILASTNHLKI